MVGCVIVVLLGLLVLVVVWFWVFRLVVVGGVCGSVGCGLVG